MQSVIPLGDAGTGVTLEVNRETRPLKTVRLRAHLKDIAD